MDEAGIDLPYDVGKMVESYANNPDYVFGVHHSYAIKGANYKPGMEKEVYNYNELGNSV